MPPIPEDRHLCLDVRGGEVNPKWRPAATALATFLASFCVAALFLIALWRQGGGAQATVAQAQARLRASSSQVEWQRQQQERREQAAAQGPVATVDAAVPAPEPGLASSSARPLNFHSDPAAFMSTVTECVRDGECRIFLNHVYKAGGTSIEDLMFATFPPNNTVIRNTCCEGDLLQRFRQSMTAFCLQKFSAYQLEGKLFEEVLHSCMDLYRQQGRGAEARIVVLTPIREPIQRGVSQINQLCNKNLGWRTPELRKACGRCSYDADRAFWDGFAQQFLNSAFLSAKHVTGLELEGVRHLLIDTLDLRQLFDGLRRSLASLGVRVHAPVHSNGESTLLCDFKMPSAMMRKLTPSVEIYRSLTSLP